MQRSEEEEAMVANRKPRKKKKTFKWNMLYFQQTKVLEEKELIGPKKRPIRMGHKLYKELSCVKCQKTFHKRISLALHIAEFHKNDVQKKKNSKSRKRKSGIVDDVCSLSGNSSSSEEFTDVELSKQFKADVKDETEDELVSSDDEFNEAWEKDNLPEPKKICRGPGANKQNGLKNLPEVQVYRKGEWEWMLDHNLFSPTIVVEDSLNAAMRRNKQQPVSSESDESFDTIESILGPDSDEELTKCEENLNDFIALNENQPNCDKRETSVSNKDEDDEEVVIDLLSSESEEESEEYPNTANNDDQRNTDDENLKQLESDPQFNCTVFLNDFVTENLLQQLKTKYNFKFDFPDPMSTNDDKNCTQNGCDSDSESSGSCIVLSSSDDDFDDDEVLPDDYDDYSDDDCCIVDDDCNTETILPHSPNDIIEIVD